MPRCPSPFSSSLVSALVGPATVAILLLAGSGLNVGHAESPAPPALPETPEHPAFAFARQDVALAEQAVQAAVKQAEQAQAAAKAVQQEVTEITAARDSLKKTIAEQEARQKQLQALQARAQEAATAAATALKTAEDAAETKPEELKVLKEQAEQTSQAVAALNAEVSALVKSLAEGTAQLAERETDLQAAAERAKAVSEAAAAEEKQLAEVKKQQTLFTERLAALNAQGTTPEPTGIRLLATFTGEYPRWSCRFDPTGRYVFAGAQERLIQRCDLITLQQTPLVGHRSWVRRMTFLPGDGSLVSGDYTGRVIRWKSSSAAPAAAGSDGSGPEAVQTIAAHRGFVRAVAISPDGRWMVTGGNDLIIRIWEADSGTLVAELPGHKRHIYNIAFHPDGRSFVSGDLMGVLKQWSTDSWEHMRDFTGGDMLVGWEGKFQADCGGIRGIHFSPDGRTLAVAGISEVSNPFAGIGKPTVVLFDWATGQRKKVLLPKSNITGHAWGVRWHPSGRFLVAACGLSQGTLVFWRPDNAEPFHEFKLPQVAYDVDLHPDGLRIAVAQFDKTVRVYDISPAPPKQETAAATPQK